MNFDSPEKMVIRAPESHVRFVRFPPLPTPRFTPYLHRTFLLHLTENKDREVESCCVQSPTPKLLPDMGRAKIALFEFRGVKQDQEVSLDLRIRSVGNGSRVVG